MKRLTYKANFYSKSFIRDPYLHYQRMRDIGSVIWLPQNRLWTITRYEDVRTALRANNVLISGKGIAANSLCNHLMTKQPPVLTSDGDDHKRRRDVAYRPLHPNAIKKIKKRILDKAIELIDTLVKRKSFDGVKDFASYLPLSVVKELVGIPEAGQRKMLMWSTAAFNTAGPLNMRTLLSLPYMKQLVDYGNNITRENISDDGFVRHLFEGVDQGILNEKEVPSMVMDYVGPSLDTTIIGSTHLLYLLGSHPDQWDKLRKSRELISSTVNEALRYSSPVRGWTRYAQEDYELGEHVIPKGSRALFVLDSANRDERKWNKPDEFDIQRNPRDHVAFGFGVHSCLGRHLAQLEMECLLEAMLESVSRIEVGKPKLSYNNSLRGYSELTATFH